MFAPHIRVTALGRLGGAAALERFSWSVNIAKSDGGILAEALLEPNQAVWEDIAADIRSFHIAPAALISPAAVLEEVKFAHIGADGRYTRDPVVVDVVNAPGVGGGYPADKHPFVIPQSALVVSLGTARRGRTGRGRFYLPMPTVELEAGTLTMPVVARDNVEARVAQMLNDINNQPGVDALGLRVVVASSKGYNTVVDDVRVGRVIDTVRSRRRSLVEAYGTATPVV